MLKLRKDDKWLQIFDKKYTYEKNLDALREDFDRVWNEQMQPSPTINISDYLIEKAVLGQGAFGTVKLYLSKKDNTYSAVKVLIKGFLVKQKQVRHILMEKKILSCVCFPFVVYLEFSLKDNSFLYLGLPFVTGGELFVHHRK